MKKMATWFTHTGKKRVETAICLLTAAVVVLGLGYMVFRLYAEHQEQKLIKERGDVKIVCLGDSIWDICRDETGIAALVEDRIQAEVYNMAIMGTSAAMRDISGEDAAYWNGKSLVSVVEAITGGENNETLTEDAERIGLYDVDYSQVDYFLIAYGLNDYFNGIERENENEYDPFTYAGALRTSVEKLQETYPNAKIVILSQTYCQGYSYGKVDTESDWKDWGGGTGPDYVATAQKVAEEYGLLFVDNYAGMGINIHNGTKYLSDATHLTEKGRRKYADILVKTLIRDYAEDKER